MIDGLLGRLWPRHRVGNILLGETRRVALVLYLVLIAGGALFRPSTALMYGIALGTAAGGLIAMLARRTSDDLPPLPHPILVGAVIAGLPAAGSGAPLLGSWSAPVIVLGLILAAVALGHWLSSDASIPTNPDGQRCVGPWDEELLCRVVSAMPTEILLEEWRVTQRRLSAGTGDQLWEVRLRELLIDELGTRDPAGTACWLSRGLTESPDRYIRRDSSLGS